MVATELGACEWFVWDLRRSNLIDRGQLDQIVGEYLQKNPRAEPPALAEFLVQKQILTDFQSERLLQGKTQGFVLGPFTLMDAIGTGSMGTVYKAQSKSDQNWYAVKVLPRRSMWNVRIARRKVRSFEQCKHPAVVPFVDVGTAGSMHYLAWPLVEGETLGKVVQERGKIAPDLAAYYLLQIAEGLDACHRQGLFHGLLKPSNIMIGTGNQVFILDFGIGCLLAETEGESLVDTMSTSNSVTSGLDFASPESIMNPQNLTPSGDQYSLGCVMYYMLTGQVPFADGSVAEKMMAHQMNEPTPIATLVADVPAELLAIVERLMKKVPEQRFANTKELVNVLKPLAGEPHVQTTPTSSANVAVRPATDKVASRSNNVVSPLRHGAGGTSVSTPTPKPRSLPSRASFRGEPAQAAAAAAPARHAVMGQASETVVQPNEAVDAGIVLPNPQVESAELTREERLGTMGITFSAITACALVFLLARLFRLF